jgi:hypothetical protein
MRPGTLLSGERILYRGAAAAIVDPADYRLPDFPLMSAWAPLVLGTVKETIGGRLFVTTHRVIFSSHPFNRVTGRVSIPLSAVDRATAFHEGLLTFGVRIDTTIGTARYVSWSAARFTRALSEARCEAALDPQLALRQDQELEGLLGDLSAVRGARSLSVLLSLQQAVMEPPGPLEIASALYAEWLRRRRDAREATKHS